MIELTTRNRWSKGKISRQKSILHGVDVLKRISQAMDSMADHDDYGQRDVPRSVSNTVATAELIFGFRFVSTSRRTE